MPLASPPPAPLAVATTGEDGPPRTLPCPARCSPASPPATSASAPSSSSPHGARSTGCDCLTDYTLAPPLPGRCAIPENPALALLEAVIASQAALIAQWMPVGFIHGVMNTDNMALSGETIDYGPCAFMDAYEPGTVYSSIDHDGRYAYGNQPAIAHWNLARLAEALLPLIDTDGDRAVARATEVLRAYTARYERAWLTRMRAKLGLLASEDDDMDLAAGLLAAMEGQSADWTLTFRALSRALCGDPGAFRAQFAKPAGADDWLALWQARQSREPGDPATRAKAMDRVNPAVIPRNHKVRSGAGRRRRRRPRPVRGSACCNHRPLRRHKGARGLRPASSCGLFRGLPHLLRHLRHQRNPAASQNRKNPWVAWGQLTASSSRRQRRSDRPRLPASASISRKRCATGPTGA